jgi:hypothetical protein
MTCESHPKTYCNPLNLNYRFQIRGWADESLREAADPSVVFFKDEFWLFPSKSGGYWHSSDLRSWSFVESRKLPVEDYAPDVRVINGKIHFTASKNDAPCAIYRTSDPLHDEWEKVNVLFPYWDPCLFQDDDGRVYLYWGCNNSTPLYAMELDKDSLQPCSERKELFGGDPVSHGWERTGDNNALRDPPYIEGAWMTKYQGKYYLQYAAPGTEFNTYGDGVYVADSPLGPFKYAPHNPFSFKPGGFITGAGHGSTFTDRFGNYWHMSTMRISVKHPFERRIGLWPAGFDEEGILFCDNSFGDYPHYFADSKWDPHRSSFTGWMLLSYRKKVEASSEMDGHPASSAVDENVRTWWSAKTGAAGEWFSLDLGYVSRICALQVNFAEEGCSQFGREGEPLYHQYLIECSRDGKNWVPLVDKRNNREDVPHDYVELSAMVLARFLKITFHHMPGQGKCALSGFRVFGIGEGALPTSVQNLVLHPQHDPSQVYLSWEKVPGAMGYNVCWGISERQIYSSWLVYDRNDLLLPCLNANGKLCFRIDAFNECGVTEGRIVPLIR